MRASAQRAVITGIGVLCPIGSDPATYWRSLLEGRSGVRRIQTFDSSTLPVQIGGEIPEFKPRDILDKAHRKSLGMMSRPVQLGVCAATLALREANIDTGTLNPTRFGVEFGAGMMPTDLDDLVRAAHLATNPEATEVDLVKWGDPAMKDIPPKWMLKYLPNMPACHASILHNAQGPNNSITEGDVAGLLALGESFRIVGRGLADLMLVGGTESKIHPLSLTRHSLFQPLSQRNDQPEQALRPFDKNHDGTVLGEGAAVFALEEFTHAHRRGARIYAEVVGFASGFDRARDGTVLAKVIRRALAEAQISPAEVDHVNAHGLGIPEADRWEAAGLHAVFGDQTPIFSAKGHLAHLGAAGGLVELIASMQALHQGELPGTRNHEEPDPECPIHVVTGAPRKVTREYVVKISFTDLGQCAAVVLKRL